jgi:hypothetical protein
MKAKTFNASFNLCCEAPETSTKARIDLLGMGGGDGVSFHFFAHGV